MATTQELTVRLSEEAVQFVRGKVSSGEFASESEVILESLESFQQQSEELERWEREEVVRAYDDFKANPASGIPIAEVEKRLTMKRRAWANEK